MVNEAERLAKDLAAGYVLVELVTWEEDRALALVREAARILKRQLSTWSLSAGFGDHKGPGGADAAGALARVAATAEARVFAFHDFNFALKDPLVVRRLRELVPLMESRGQGIVLTTPASCLPVELEKEIVVMDLAPPGRKELLAILDEGVKAAAHKGALATDAALRDAVIRAAHGLTAREMRRMMKRSLALHPDFNKEHVREVLDEKRQVLRRSELLEFYEASETLSDVGGLEILKKWLTDRAEAFTDRARQYGLPEPKGLLLLGVQGCGKSLSAKAVSGLWGIPLIRLDLSAILDRETEGDQLRRSLNMAAGLAPCVLWIDEIEKGFSAHRVSGREEHGRMARAFAAFLTWLQEKKEPVYVIATANSISELPPELVRKGRFDDIFFVDLPKELERAEIFRIHLAKRSRDPEKFDVIELSRGSEGFSGSEIEQAVISAMYDAFTAGREVETSDVRRALADTVPLSETLEEAIKELRDWAKTRARPASLDTKLMDLLHGGKK
jgi:SpoVK/Ycf46/Vps4 family AAA+-type ATPase